VGLDFSWFCWHIVRTLNYTTRCPLMKLHTIMLFACALHALLCYSDLPGADALPSLVGFTETKGGQGGAIIRVTSLAKEGPGSLREALNAKGRRIVVFEVGGVIDLEKESLVVTEPFLTIAGQTAPSPGITLIRGGMQLQAHDVIVKHIRIRPGDAGEPKKSGWEPDGLGTSGPNAHDIIVDHCSFTWATDENLSASGPRLEGPDQTSRRITFSHNIIAECLSNSTHAKGEHSKGSLIHDFCRDIAVIGNLYAHNVGRNPYFKAHTTGVIVNNLIYNPGKVAVQLGYWETQWARSSYKPENCRVSIVGNVMRHGPNSPENLILVRDKGEAYMSDNLALNRKGQPVGLHTRTIRILDQKPVWPERLKPLPASRVEAYVLKNAGARPRERDPIDTRIVEDVKKRGGRIIDSQDEVGGYPKVEKTTRKLRVPEENVQEWLDAMADKLE